MTRNFGALQGKHAPKDHVCLWTNIHDDSSRWDEGHTAACKSQGYDMSTMCSSSNNATQNLPGIPPSLPRSGRRPCRAKKPRPGLKALAAAENECREHTQSVESTRMWGSQNEAQASHEDRPLGFFATSHPVPSRRVA